MSLLSLAARRAYLVSLRDTIDANGGGALQLFGNTMAATPEADPGASPIAIITLAEVSFALHATDAQIDLVPVVGNAAMSGQPLWGRYVDGGGAGVLLCTVGPPGSGAQLIATNLDDPGNAVMYTGGEIALTQTIVAT